MLEADDQKPAAPAHIKPACDVDNKLIEITKENFLQKAKEEYCLAVTKEEIQDAVSPKFLKYSCNALEFISRKTFPLWRVNTERTEILPVKIPPNEAFPISFLDLSNKTDLFKKVNFDSNKNYLLTKQLIVFHCTGCDVFIIKDGNHRLLQCACGKIDDVFEIYQVSSNDWSRCTPDMKNFCECIPKRK